MAKLPNGLIKGEDGVQRCPWHDEKSDYRNYHDHEWGMPVDDDIKLFEKICLEGFQAGLSWLTILRKRENFREAFAGFDFEKVAQFGDKDVELLVENVGIIRHRGKIVSTINNAKRAIEMAEAQGSLGAWFWAFEPQAEDRPKKLDWETLKQLGKTEVSTDMSKQLKKRGWSFVGPTTCYAFMQAMGLVNDHIQGCAFRETVENARTAFLRPG